jgi:hypothetical protein
LLVSSRDRFHPLQSPPSMLPNLSTRQRELEQDFANSQRVIRNNDLLEYQW